VFLQEQLDEPVLLAQEELAVPFGLPPGLLGGIEGGVPLLGEQGSIALHRCLLAHQLVEPAVHHPQLFRQ
jgi:hypothetical protein